MAKAEAKVHAAHPEREVARHAKMEALFADAQIDAVLLVLPIPLMPAAIESALRAGKHVLSEKPVAPSVEEAHRLLGVMHELGARAPAWLVLENWAYKPSVLWLRERLHEQAIGRIVTAHCTHHHPDDGGGGRGGQGGNQAKNNQSVPQGGEASWRSRQLDDGFWLVDVGVHWARMLRLVLGEPSAASGVLTSTSTASTASTAASDAMHGWITLEHCASALTLSLSSGGPRRAATNTPPSLRIDGDRGTICWWAGDGKGGRARVSLERAVGGGGDGRVGDGGAAAGEGSVEMAMEDDWVEGGVMSELEHALTHLNAIRHAHRPGAGGPPTAAQQAARACCRLHADEAVRDLALIDMFLRSHRERRVVAAPEALLRPSSTSPLDAVLRRPVAAVWDASATRRVVPACVVPCATAGEVATAMRLAKSLCMRPSPLGWAHSWSGSYCPPVADGARSGVAGDVMLLPIASMDRVLEIDAQRRTVRVEPGVTLRELRRALAAHDLTLASWPMLLDQTVAGASVGCGAHGSAPRDGTISDDLVEVVMVCVDGMVVTLRDDGHGAGAKPAGGSDGGDNCDNGDNGDNGDDGDGGDGACCAGVDGGPAAPPLTLRAARVSLGSCGVVVSLTLRCEPRYYVRRHIHVLTVTEFVARADALCDAYRHLWVWWALGEAQMCACALEDVGAMPAAGARRYDGENWYKGAPPLIAPRTHITASTPAATSSNDEGTRWVSMQYAFPRSRLGALIERLTSAAPLKGLAGQVVELKFVGAGSSARGINRDGPMVGVNVLWRVPLGRGVQRADDEGHELGLDPLAALERELVELGGVPHWGKRHGLGRQGAGGGEFDAAVGLK